MVQVTCVAAGCQLATDPLLYALTCLELGRPALVLQEAPRAEAQGFKKALVPRARPTFKASPLARIRHGPVCFCPSAGRDLSRLECGVPSNPCLAF